MNGVLFYKVLGRHGEMRQQTRHSEVTAILVLCGLPRYALTLTRN